MIPLSYYLVLSGFLFACGVAVFLIKRNGVIGFINEAMATTLGYRVDELLGTDYMRLVANDQLAAQTSRRQAVF